jgi:histone H3/H4
MVKRATPTPYAAKSEKLSRSVKKIVKKLSNERTGGDKKSTKGFTLSSQATTEMELLIEHAINNIAYNAGAILKYSGAGTITTKTMMLATGTAFNGLLKKSVLDAGEEAVEKYHGSTAETAAQPVGVES